VHLTCVHDRLHVLPKQGDALKNVPSYFLRNDSRLHDRRDELQQVGWLHSMHATFFVPDDVSR